MYAHQVIEDIKRLTKSQNPVTEKWIKLIPYIQNSQKFHGGDVEDMENIMQNFVGLPLFSEKASLALPYDMVWMDFSFLKVRYAQMAREGEPPATNSREGALIIKAPLGVIMTFFTFFEEVKTWVPPPCSFAVFEGNLSHEEISKIQSINKAKVGKDCFLDSNPPPGVGKILTIPFTDLDSRTVRAVVGEYGVNFKLVYWLIKIMNCKNITPEVIKAPEALNKKRRRNGKQEIFDYHVLNVTVPGKKGEYREKTEALSHVRVHLCRGHFKEYTAEHPLLGRHIGLYWWQPHVRGQNRDGVVMKEYNVRTE